MNRERKDCQTCEFFRGLHPDGDSIACSFTEYWSTYDKKNHRYCALYEKMDPKVTLKCTRCGNE